MVVGMIEGKLYHNSFSQDIYEAKDILYITGAYALAAGVPVRKYFERGDLFKLGTLSIVCATLLDLMMLGHVSVNTNLPGLPLSGFGGIGAETAALFMAVGTMCFLTRLAMGPVALRHVLALIPIVVSVVLASQRAILVNLGVVLFVVLAAVVVGHWQGPLRRFHGRVRPGRAGRAGGRRGGHRRRRRSRRGGSETGTDPAGLDLPEPLPQPRQGGVGPGPPEPGGRGGEVDPPAPPHRLGAGDRIPLLRGRDAHGGDGRLRPQHRPRPVAQTGPRRPGQFLPGPDRLDRRRPPGMATTSRSRTAALALALVAVVSGLVATGFLEPLLDEYRFAALFGVCLGMLRACVTSMDVPPRALTWSVEATGAGHAGRTCEVGLAVEPPG